MFLGRPDSPSKKVMFTEPVDLDEPPVASRLPRRSSRPSFPLDSSDSPSALRSYKKGSVVWAPRAPEEPVGDSDYDPTKKFQDLDIGDYSKGISEKDRKLRLAQLEKAMAALKSLPALPSPKRKRVPSKGTAKSTPTKKTKKPVPPPASTRTLRTRKPAVPSTEAMDIDDDESDEFLALSESEGSSVQETPSKKKKKGKK